MIIFEWEVTHEVDTPNRYIEVQETLSASDIADFQAERVEIWLYVRELDKHTDDYTHIDSAPLNDDLSLSAAFIKKHAIPASILP